MTARDRHWVIVSGAAGALGQGIVSHFAGKGHPVLALDRSPCSFPHAGAVTRALELSEEDQLRQVLSEAISPGASVALLVNAVGLIWNEPALSFKGAKLATHSLDSWRKVVEANLTAPFAVAAQVAARMVRRGGGAIVNFSSIASNGNPGQAAYSAAKAGIEGMTRTLAAELGPLGVRVNALALGFIDVASTRAAVAGDQLEDYARKSPLGRLGHLQEVISAIEFLEANTFVNGAIMKLDGGLRLG